MFSKNRIAVLVLVLLSLLAGPLAAFAGVHELLPVQLIFDNEDGVDGMGGPRQVVASPDGKFIYIPGESDSAIAFFSRDKSNGELTFAGSSFDGIDANGIFGCSSISISPDGKHLYATGAFGSSIAAFERDKKTGALTFVDAYFNGVDGVSGLASTVWSAVSPDGKHVYAAGFSDGAIVTFNRDKKTGALEFVDKFDGIPGLFGFDLSPDGKHVYVTALQASSIVGFERDQQTGLLSVVDIETDGVNGVDGLRAARALAVSPNGKTVYVAGLLDNAISVFSRDPSSGELTFQQVLSAVANGIPSLFRATHVTVSNNGAKVYVAGFAFDSVASFNSDKNTGLLTFAGSLGDPIDGRTPLDGIIGTWVSKSGKHLYATGFFGDGLVVIDASKK